MVIATVYINMGKGTLEGTKYKFDYNVYRSVDSATACFIINHGTIRSTPCIVTKRASGTFVLTYSSTSLYISAANPMEISTSDVD